MYTMLVASFCRAQDTVQYLDPCYLFNEKHPYTVYPYSTLVDPFDTSIRIQIPRYPFGWDGMCCNRFPGYENISYAYAASEPVMVYGVAMAIVGPNQYIFTEEDLKKSPYEIIIGRRENNKIVAIDSTTWDSEKDAIVSFKYSMMGDGVLYEQVVPIYEFYFDTPHLITDTFYVGYRDMDPEDSIGNTMLYGVYYSVDSVSQNRVANNDVQLLRGLFNYHWGGEFPILQPNRRCAAPDAPEWVVYNTTNTVRFTLPYSPGDSLLLSICREGLPMDSATIYPVTGSTMDIVVPDSGRYTARLARVCQRDILVQSGWSAPATFPIMNNLSIPQPSVPTLEVHPNPTDGTVLIPAEGIREVWCVAADGRRTRLDVKDGLGDRSGAKVYDKVSGQVSLKDHHAGLYVLEIQAAEGLFTAKVVKR